MFKAKCFAIVVSLAVGFVALPSAVEAQSPASTAPVPAPILVWHPGSVHYHYVYQGRYWYLSPGVGWYAEDRYTYVPHWTPGYYSYAVDSYGTAPQVVRTAWR
jgi:hypothetical protein